MKHPRGYYGIAFYEPKRTNNMGVAIRSANCFGANFIAVIGARYRQEPGDTMATDRHIPIYQYRDEADFRAHIPINCTVIGLECDGTDCLETMQHPERCIYVFGGEDRTLPQSFKRRVRLSTSHCLNMAVTASIVMYDRQAKRVQL